MRWTGSAVFFSLLKPPEQKKQFNANFEKRLTERPAAKGKMPATAE
jgi:Spy/CpxP family protein refolding chaperone